MGHLGLRLPPSADGTELNPKQGTDVSLSPQLAREQLTGRLTAMLPSAWLPYGCP